MVVVVLTCAPRTWGAAVVVVVDATVVVVVDATVVVVVGGAVVVVVSGWHGETQKTLCFTSEPRDPGAWIV
ncbi:MAG TPA: hypothetical protein VKX24_02695, partial [Acidimicrobiia bacterium]|nr:hypothetical protein [Acidimicrobiia bacterium]